MSIATLVAASLALSAPTPATPSFHARCSNGESATALFVPHRAPGVPLIYPPDRNAGTIDIIRRQGRYAIQYAGYDVAELLEDSATLKIEVLNREPGDLALEVKSSKEPRSISIYHLYYHGSSGMLTLTQTTYNAKGGDEAELTAMHCKVMAADESKGH